jgi:hypothetical protein
MKDGKIQDAAFEHSTNNRSTKIGAAVSFDDQRPYFPI